MTPLASWVLAASVQVEDAAHHRFKGISPAGAEAIADGCTRAPLFAGPDGPRQCAAILLVMAARESAYRLEATGDGGRSHGAWQSQTCTGACLTSWTKQVENILGVYRRSITTCAEPLALAASGSCTNKAGERISRERMRLAHDVYAAVPWEVSDG